MTIRRRTLAAAAAMALVVTGGVIAGLQTADAATYPDPGAVTGSTNVHDPGIVKRTDGTYLIAHTDDNITLKTSTDRTAWHDAGTAFPNGASWTQAYTGGGNVLWAPDISYHNGRYYMYYAASTFGSNHSGIFLATSSTAASAARSRVRLMPSVPSALGSPRVPSPALPTNAAGAHGPSAARPRVDRAPPASVPAEGS